MSRTSRSNARWEEGDSSITRTIVILRSIAKRCVSKDEHARRSVILRGSQELAPQDDDPNFSCHSGHSRSGLNGTAVKRTPVASASALARAAGTRFDGVLLLVLGAI